MYENAPHTHQGHQQQELACSVHVRIKHPSHTDFNSTAAAGSGYSFRVFHFKVKSSLFLLADAGFGWYKEQTSG